MRLLNVDEVTRQLIPVTQPVDYVINVHGEKVPHEAGLLSEKIFGKTLSQRKLTMSYIDFNGVEILSPQLYHDIKLDKKLNAILMCEKKFKFNNGELIEDNNEGETGLSFFKRIAPYYHSSTKKAEEALEIIRHEDRNRVYNSRLIVLPAGLRENPQKLTVTDLTKQYIRVLRLAQNVSATSSKVDEYSALLQRECDKVYTLDIALSNSKEGITRRAILSKRVDFSARAVISLDLNLDIDECGLSYKIAMKIFEPFLYYDLKKQYKWTKLQISSILDEVKLNGETSPYFSKVIKSLNNIASKRLVLLSRDPVLHKLGLLAFKPKIIKDDVITISPAVCSGFNADFDGDQMAVYTPLTAEALEDAKKMLPSNHLISAASKDLVLGVSQNFSILLFFLTYKVDYKKNGITLKDLKKKQFMYDFSRPLTVNGKRTTVGRYLITDLIRTATKDKNFPLIDKPLDKKEIKSLLYSIYDNYGKNAALTFITSFTRLSRSISLYVPDMFEQLYLSDEAKKTLKPYIEKLINSPKNWDDIERIVKEDIERHSPGFASLINAKLTKLSWSKITQALVSKGFIRLVNGELKLIQSNQLDGLSPNELFFDSSNNRLGLIDRAINPAISGYLTRKLVFALSTVRLSNYIDDCGTSKTLPIVVTEKNMYDLLGRYMIKNGNLVKLTKSVLRNHLNKQINLRTPMYCKSPEICKTCYGSMSKLLNSTNIGIIAAQSLGERATQMLLRTFHVDSLVKDLVERNVLTIHKCKFNDEKNSYVSTDNIDIVIDTNDIIERSDYEIKTTKFKIDDKVYEGMFIISLMSADVHYKPPVVICHMPKGVEAILLPSDNRLNEEVSKIRSLLDLSSELKVTNAQALLGKLYTFFNTLGDIDHVHFEVVVSLMMRSKSQPEIVYRLSDDTSYVLVGINKVLFYENPKVAFLFERQGEALRKLLYKDVVLSENQKEKVTLYSDFEEFFF